MLSANYRPSLGDLILIQMLLNLQKRGCDHNSWIFFCPWQTILAHLHELFITQFLIWIPFVPAPIWKYPLPGVLGHQVICIYRNSLTQRSQVKREKAEFLQTQLPLWLS